MVTRIVEEIAPADLQHAFERRAENVCGEWRTIVDGMQQRVRDKATDNTWAEDEAQARGYAWRLEVDDVTFMIRHLFARIGTDLGLDGEEPTPAMFLVEKALVLLKAELHDSNGREAPHDSEENQLRVLRALKALLRAEDDENLRRARALQIAEGAAEWIKTVPTKDPRDVCERGAEMSEEEASHIATFWRDKRPVLDGVTFRGELAEIDSAFRQLDPLVVFEEFSEASAKCEGGRSQGGGGRAGAARALARLTVRCGALGFRVDEDFDGTVERVRGQLLASRAKIRRELRSHRKRLLAPEEPSSEQ